MNTITQDEKGGEENVYRLEVDLLSCLHQFILACCTDM